MRLLSAEFSCRSACRSCGAAGLSLPPTSWPLTMTSALVQLSPTLSLMQREHGTCLSHFNCSTIAQHLRVQACAGVRTLRLVHREQLHGHDEHASTLTDWAGRRSYDFDTRCEVRGALLLLAPDGDADMAARRRGARPPSDGEAGGQRTASLSTRRSFDCSPPSKPREGRD